MFINGHLSNISFHSSFYLCNLSQKIHSHKRSQFIKETHVYIEQNMSTSTLDTHSKYAWYVHVFASNVKLMFKFL